MTLVELMVAIGVGSIVLVIVSVLTVAGARSFASVGNYAILQQRSSVGVDEITRELRLACGVWAYQTNGLPKWLIVTNSDGYTVKYSLDTDHQMTMKKSNKAEPDVLLDGCDNWNFSLLNGAPTANGFTLATNKNDCKIISMSWKCSRFMGRTNSVSTEAVQTAQIVMRNKK
jgi:Tfp pilus assembly protein PilW